MANFVGSLQEFHHFIGPRVRNVVNQAAAPHRKRREGICEECGEKAELQSAHVHGRGRRTIIEEVLARYTNSDGVVACDLQQVEKEIVSSHIPIEETFKFLCHLCHVEYDSPKPATKMGAPNRRQLESTPENQDFRKLNRIGLWANRPNQDCSRILRAFLTLEEKEGEGNVEVSKLRDYCTEQEVSGFDGKYASMKTNAGNSYGKVFFDDGSIVGMWPEVRREVGTYFNKPLQAGG